METRLHVSIGQHTPNFFLMEKTNVEIKFSCNSNFILYGTEPVLST